MYRAYDSKPFCPGHPVWPWVDGARRCGVWVGVRDAGVVLCKAKRKRDGSVPARSAALDVYIFSSYPARPHCSNHLANIKPSPRFTVSCLSSLPYSNLSASHTEQLQSLYQTQANQALPNQPTTMAIAFAFAPPTNIRPSTSSSTSSSSSLLTTSTTSAMPTAHRPAYIRSGIGGAGNWHKACSIQSSPTPAHNDSSPVPLLQYHSRTQQQTHIKSGIGGAGNVHAISPASALAYEEELARSRRAVLERANAGPSSFHVGIGGAGNFRAKARRGERVIRGQRSTGHLGLGMKRSEGDLRVEASAVGAVLPRAVGKERERRVSWGEGNVEEYEVEEGDWEKECVYYSNEPLPYGALDVLRRRLERAFSRGGREVLATPGEKGRAVQLGGDDGQERRVLRSHRSTWRF